MKILFDVIKTILQYLALVAIGTWAIVEFKITLSIIASLLVVLIMVVIVGNWKHIRMNRKFFKENEEKYFLWYSSNKRFKEKIENHLIPLLSDIPLQIIYNNKNQIESNQDDFALQMLRSKTFKTKLPILFKVENGILHCETFHDEILQIRFEGLTVSKFDEKVLFKLEKRR